MSETISLYELLNLSIGTPQRGAVNFGALHALLHAVLGQLGMREMKTQWRDTPPPGDRHPDAPVGVAAPEQDPHTEEEHQIHGDVSTVERDVRSDTELQERAASPSSPAPAPASSDPAADSQWRLRSRIETCEEDVSKALKLVLELHEQKHTLEEEMKELRLQQQIWSLRDPHHKDPDPEEPAGCWTRGAVQPPPADRDHLHKEFVDAEGDEAAAVLRTTDTPFITAPARTSTPSSSPPPPHPVEDTATPAASPTTSGQISTLQEVRDALPAPQDPPVLSGPHTRPETGPMPADVAPPRTPGRPKRHPETAEGSMNIDTLKERVDTLEARVAALEEGKVDQVQLTRLAELVTNEGSQEASNNLLDLLEQQRAVTQRLMSEQEKLDSLDDMCMNQTSQDSDATAEAAPGSAESDSKASRVLRQQIFQLRRSVQKLEEDLEELKATQAVTEGRATDPHLQDQLDDLRGMLEDMMLSLTSELSSSLQDEAVEDESDGQGLAQSQDTTSTVNVGRKLSRLFQHYEQLQDTVSSLPRQQAGGAAGALKHGENVELVNDVQKAILQLQAECEKLQESSRCLHEDNRQKQSHIEELYKTTEELEEKKADKQMVESEIKADKWALEGKVSRLQFDSVTEQLNAMFHELLSKVTGQEQDWHKVVDRLSTEMECKLNRMELDSVKRQLEGRWRNIHEKLQAQGAPEHDDAAGLRKQLVDRFHCLSCDRPVVKYTPGPHSVKLPSSPGFPSHKSIRPFTVYALEQFRQHYRRPGTNRYNFEVANPGWRREQLQKSHAVMCRQIESVQRRLQRSDAARDGLIQNQPGAQHERVSEVTDYTQLAVSRSCGGSHTITSASQRRSGLQYLKHHPQTEGDATVHSEEVDIVGLDGHIYKGRLNAPAIRSEMKLPTISTKDGACRTKDKARSSPTHRPAASPEAHRPHSAKSAQCSRSASSSSGRDWPVSALGCTSLSSVTPASAAAESSTEPQAEEPLHL